MPKIIINGKILYNSEDIPTTPEDINAMPAYNSKFIYTTDDWNTFTDVGSYKVQNATMDDEHHAPSNEYNFGILFVLKGREDTEHRTVQIYYPHLPAIAVMWVRMSNSSGGIPSWTAWNPITSKQVNDNTYLKKSGDSVLGNLLFAKSSVDDGRKILIDGNVIKYILPSGGYASGMDWAENQDGSGRKTAFGYYKNKDYFYLGADYENPDGTLKLSELIGNASSATIAKQLQSYFVGSNISNKTTKPWYKVAECETTKIYGDSSCIFLIYSSFGALTNCYGIVKASFRTNEPATGTPQNAKIIWLMKNEKIAENILGMVRSNITDGVKYTLYVKIPEGAFHTYNIVVLSNAERDSNLYKWVFANNYKGDGDLESITASGVDRVISSGYGSLIASRIGTTNVGSDQQPIYLDGGVPAVCNGELLSPSMRANIGFLNFNWSLTEAPVAPKATGTYSIAIGNKSVASNNYSIALGYNNIAASVSSIALGYNSQSTGYVSIAIGTGSQSTGYSSIALGDTALATYDSSMAIGTGSQSTGYSSIALGSNANSSSGNSIAIGSSAYASGQLSIALGSNAKAQSITGSCIAIGAKAQALGNFSMALGFNAKTANINSIQLGGTTLSSLTSKVGLTVTSDERDKTDIEPIQDALSFINKVKAISYYWNLRSEYVLKDEDGNEILTNEERAIVNKYGFEPYDKEAHALGTKKGTRRRVGVSAQQVQEALIETYGTADIANLVNDNLHDFDPNEIPEGVESKLGVTYENFIPFLIKAIQELSTKVDKDEREIYELKSMFNSYRELEERVGKLEA